LNNLPDQTNLERGLFDFNISGLEDLALQIFRFQSSENQVYREYIRQLRLNPEEIRRLEDIPFLPISFFKTHRVVTGEFVPAAIFESSGTTGSLNSRHHVKDLELYRRSFLSGFRMFYGEPAEWCIIGLLPSYLERKGSSLVTMVDELIRQSGMPESGFYLNEYEKLSQTLSRLEERGQKTLLIGVSFALLDFAESFPMRLANTVIMETGGMKGRRQEMTREQLHAVLCNAFGLNEIHSEYGMTEMLSQAYSKGQGIFRPSHAMRVLLREDDDPMAVFSVTSGSSRGIINVVDLCNVRSCSFLATDDSGVLHADGSFEVTGRVDNSDIRGCSLMVV